MTISQLLSKSFLFRGLLEEEIDRMLEENRPTKTEYKRGQTVFSSDSAECGVGFLISGECQVLREKNGGKTLINTLSAGDCFGILSVFSKEEFPTTVVAARACRILFFSSEQIKLIIAGSSVISANLIDFLVGRISFLNRKIATFSCTRVEERLAAYVLSATQADGQNSIKLNYVKIAEQINAGRASVYRAIESLTAEHLVSIDGKILTVTNRQGLERMIK